MASNEEAPPLPDAAASTNGDPGLLPPARRFTDEERLARVDIEATFVAMAHRRLRRQLGGVRKPTLPGVQKALWIILYLSIGVGFVGLQGGLNNLEVRVSIFKNAATFVFFTLILAFIWIALNNHVVVRWCLAWLLLGTGLVLIVGDPSHKDVPLPFVPLFEWGSTAQIVIACCTFALIAFTILFFVSKFYVYPYLLRRLDACTSATRLWSIQRVWRDRPQPVSRRASRASRELSNPVLVVPDPPRGQPGGGQTHHLEYTYTPLHVFSWVPRPQSWRKRRHFSYVGELGETSDGRTVPHGWGTWTDTAKHGERLTGFWENGLPIGPFRSLELRTGCAFVNLRVGFASNSASAWDASPWVPTPSPVLRWGVIAVEVSVAGHWFKGLPAATLVSPLAETDAGDALSKLNHVGSHTADPTAPPTRSASHRLEGQSGELQTITVSLGSPQDHLHVSGHRAVDAESAKSATITFDDGGSGGVPSLALEGGWRRGEFAQEALVWIPGFNASSDVIAMALAQLLALGNFPAYIKPFLFAWPNGRELTYPLAEAFAATAEMRRDMTEFFRSIIDDAGIDQIHVLVHSMGSKAFFNALPDIAELLRSRNAAFATTIFLNADSPLEEFTRTSFPLLRQVCHHVTVYADANDMALFYSRFISYLSACLPKVPDIATRTPLGKYPYRLHSEKVGRAAPSGDASEASEALQEWRQLRLELPVDYLDLDVIDTSSLDANVHGLRHVFFNLNSFVVDDLAEIVTARRRACNRRRLVHCVGNVWTFLAAPLHVSEL